MIERIARIVTATKKREKTTTSRTRSLRRYRTSARE
jgi:hypothetical protein